MEGRYTHRLPVRGADEVAGLADTTVVLLAPGILALDHFLNVNAFEPLCWMGCALLFIRIVKTGNQRLWIWFGILARKVIRRGHFASLADLQHKLEAFVDYFNRTMAKPFKWTYQGKPLQGLPAG